MILSFEKPKKIRSTETHNEMNMSDSGVAGTYVSNMSEADKKRFKGKYIKGADERVEIRIQINGVNVLIKVFKNKKETKGDWRAKANDHNKLQMSMNGKLDITLNEWALINDSIDEAKCLLDGDFTPEDFN